MIRTVLERALGVELADHLGHDRGTRPGPVAQLLQRVHLKTVITSAGQARIEVPRDRNGSFEPQMVPQRRRRIGNTSDMILNLYAPG